MSDQEKQSEEGNKRLASFGILGLGLLGCAVFVIYPLVRAHMGVDQISVSEKYAGGSIAVLAIGIMSLCGLDFIKDDQNITLRDLVMIVVVVALGIGAFFLFKGHLESLGYHFPKS